MTLAAASLDAYEGGTNSTAYGYIPRAVYLTVESATPVTVAMSETLGCTLDLGIRDIMRMMAEAMDMGVLPSQGLVPPPLCLHLPELLNFMVHTRA